MKQKRIGKMRDGPTPQYNHSAIFIGDNITGDELNTVRVKLILRPLVGEQPITTPLKGECPIIKPLGDRMPHNQTT
jgi:hypothetical protein